MAARRKRATRVAPFVERRSSESNVFSLLRKREVWIGIIVVLAIFGVIRFRERMAGEQGGARPTPSVNGGTSEEEKKKAGELANVSGKAEVVAKDGETFTSISQKYCGSEDFAYAIKARNGGGELKTGDKVTVECVK